MDREHLEHEQLVSELRDKQAREEYKKPLDTYRPALLPRLIGKFLVACGNLLYGHEPSYLKFRAVEVIARVPYHSWTSVAFTLLTLFYTDEERARKLSRMTRFSRFAADNETMHVVVISALTQKEQKAGFLRYTLIPACFAFIYFWFSYLLYLIYPRYSLEINYLFEQHAYEQYDRFLGMYGTLLRGKSIESTFLADYGRHPRSQYEFFELVRNDELVHRNQSIHEITTQR
ncbi:MAG: alternative oxidase [Patescibacteria group bacterium]